ncbi:MAG: OmpA family protein [Bryobacter sp.]|nr:OmpA family protein [Bryobacter sp.]
MIKNLRNSGALAALAIAPFITGCATKKFVRTTVAPIEQKVGELDATTKSQADSIATLEKGVARAEEKAMGADQRAENAAKEAALARQEAAANRSFTETGLQKVSTEMNTMDGAIKQRLANLRDYRLVASESVLFGLGKSELTEEAEATLDEMVAGLNKMQNFVMELQGFTDSTGSKAANLALSKRRAEAVVRYLTTRHNIPLHRIYVAGLGDEVSVADNKTRDGRKQNRRVDMKVYLSADEANEKNVPALTTNAKNGQ